MPDNLLRMPAPYSDPDNPLTQGTPTWADVPGAGTLMSGVSKGTGWVDDWLAGQQQQSLQQGMWTGGSVFQGGRPTGAGLVNAAGQYGNALMMGSIAPGAPKPISAFHATEGEPFAAYDWKRLGESTESNSPTSWAMSLARLGPWASEKPVGGQLIGATDMPVTIGGKGKSFKSLDDLAAAIEKSGGPEALRQKLTDAGYGHVKVKDEEFGGKSYVALAPEHFQVTPRGDAE